MTTKDTIRLIQVIIGLGSVFLGLQLIHPGLTFIVIGLFFLFLFVASFSDEELKRKNHE